MARLFCLFSVFFFLQISIAADIDGDFLTKLEPLKDAKYVATPEETHQPLYDAFDSAKKSVKVGIFSISGKAIAQKLADTAKHRIAITIIYNNNCFKSPSKQLIIDNLKASGAIVLLATPGFTISHWKMFVIDDQTAFISTMNWVTRTEQMRDMGIFINNPSVVAEILAVYNQDLENIKNQTAITPPLTHPNLLWSPVNAEPKLVALINSAKTTIDIWIENMGNKAVHEALKNAVARNVKVRLLTSVCGLGMPASAAYPNLKQLSGYGVEVKGAPWPATTEVPYIHAKTITVDQKTVFIGSENFSTNSLLKARELGIIFEDATVVSQMRPLFEKDWSNGVAIPDKPPEKCSALQPTPPPANPTPN